MSHRSLFYLSMFLLTIPVTLAIFATAQQTTLKQVPVKPTSRSSGQEMFNAYCVSCHGKDGKGGGPAASALKVPPPDLTLLSKNNNGKFPSLHVYQIIQGDAAVAAHGSKDMPVWGPVLRSMGGHDEAEVHLRINNLKNYIESIQAK
jgi:mono/diheme cytochrome c family protein